MKSNDRQGQKAHGDDDAPINQYQTDDDTFVIADERKSFAWIESHIGDIAILEDWR